MTRQSLVSICLIFLTRHCYLVSQLLTVKLLAPSPHSFQFCDLQMFLTKKRTFGDLCLNFLLGRERKKKKRKKAGLIWTALIGFPRREIPFHFMHPFRLKQCSCAVGLTQEDTAKRPAWDCPWLCFPTVSLPPTTWCFSPRHLSEVIIVVKSSASVFQLRTKVVKDVVRLLQHLRWAATSTHCLCTY